MKKEYLFLILIIVILYLLYLIVNYKYNEYIINLRIETLYIKNEKVSDQIKNKIDDIEYKTTNAYKNMVLKEEQWLKNKWENVIYLIEEKKYEKYTKKTEDTLSVDIVKTKDNNVDSMNIMQKWVYLIFRKDIR